MKKMLKISLFFAVQVILFLQAGATHIVGGEFEMIYTGRANVYNVNMNMYFDDINAAPGLLEADLTIRVGIFTKGSNILVQTLELRRTTTDLITYTVNGCNAPNEIRTRFLRYVGSIDLTGYTNPQGYYISWERCCRNYQSINMVHMVAGEYVSGQVFYLEFPPIQTNSGRLINSSPIFVPIPAEFLCRNNFYTINFGANDIDGDSLVFKMITPLQGHTTEFASTLPTPLSAPYQPISWRSGYSATNAIPGIPALNIGLHTGILSVNPLNNGLFVFAVVCEEYRRGIKIGEVRRDFQYLVKDCPVKLSPSVGLNAVNNNSTNPGSANWGKGIPDTLVVKLNKDTCYTIFVTDSTTTVLNKPEFVSISYGQTNLPPTAINFSPSRVEITPSNDTTTMSMCFSTCDKVLIEGDSIYFLDILVRNGVEGDCPRKTDLLRTYIYVDVDENNNVPKISTTLAPIDSSDVYPDSLISFIVYGTDTDQFDLREITIDGERFDINNYNMQFTKVFENADSIAYRFSWVPLCEYLDKRLRYQLNFTLKDKTCRTSHNVNTSVVLNLREIDFGLQDIIPSNLITPNGDGLNECLFIPNIPKDDCKYKFKNVSIYNRWGSKIYESSDRNFKWCPNELSDGVYYVAVDLTAKTIKGWAQLIR